MITMPHPLKVTIVGIFASTLVASCGDSNNSDPIDLRSKLAFGSCAVKIQDPSALCGVLTVAQDRNKKDSKLIGLPFAILPAKAAKPEKDPIVVYTGGPGISPLQTFAAVPGPDLENYPVRQKRDLIVLTHRGTELTEGGTIECPEVVLDFAAGARYKNIEELLVNSRKCRDRIVAQGIDPLQYNTKTIARDMEDLRLLLGKVRGFTEWNILGSSYGSLLAQQSLRDTPAGGIRSVVFDGPVPFVKSTFFASNILEALEEIVIACGADSTCAQDFPDLRMRFSDTLQALEKTPTFFDGNRVTPQSILVSLRSNLPIFRPAFEQVPLFMDLIVKGEWARADAIFSFLNIPEIVSGTSGMFYTVSCTDAGTEVTSESSMPSGATNWPASTRRLAALAEYGVIPKICPVWVTDNAKAAVDRSPIKTSVPSLITVGQFDIATPAVDADLLLAGLTKGQKVVFVGRGHGLAEGEPCMLKIAAAFFDNPNAPIKKDCIDSPSSLRFERASP
jgi:pimeloyl-ACP methyl ester carboxylesterase